MGRQRLRVLIERAQSGDDEALAEIIHRFMPAIRKYARHMEDDEANLVLWLTDAIQRYKPRTSWGMEELLRYKKERKK